MEKDNLRQPLGTALQVHALKSYADIISLLSRFKVKNFMPLGL
jgi:hypothetical protein